jgi:tetratricopeptide (TPR) repeat protein
MKGGARAVTMLAMTALLVAGAVTAGRADTAPPASRDAAIAALADPGNVDGRRLAARWLGEHGSMEDAGHLVRALRDPDHVVRGVAESAMWQLWSRSGDPETDRLFAVGLEQMGNREGAAAVETFTRVIERRPGFAEGWNKRATVYYILGEYAKSLADCDEVIRRNPHHFGALSGYGMIYLQLDEPERALGYFERALAVNPNLQQVEEVVETLRQMLIQRRKDTI